MSFQGKITEWNDDRGFGFIESDEGGKRVFVHIKSFLRRTKRPLVDDVVIYEVATDERGRFQARNVSFYVKPVQISNYYLKNFLFLLLVVFFFVFLGVSAVYGKLPFMIFGYIVIISGITFFAYSIDKSAAQDGDWRLSEGLLHVLSILGGWAGALAAQVLIRHKSKKRSFRIVFWATVALNCLLLSSLSTDYIAIFFKDTLGLM